ncbi:hypothetical protein ATI02_4342 [Pseudomonas baetica]|uniref:Uncharacterized protein n=1 Tax=Pseudomonas baetica TaxID=674054 RepID=A0ABX4Q3J7_9PSED|nr:hypothetical protein [Pseudomonas baetica]PKA71364.1 hypothetical protein ATI02_4342 [Pseudomonas baetica]PTC19862.1 hypothetical protein C0J26_07645 [Pseudomonas baetica]
MNIIDISKYIKIMANQPNVYFYVEKSPSALTALLKIANEKYYLANPNLILLRIQQIQETGQEPTDTVHAVPNDRLAGKVLLGDGFSCVEALDVFDFDLLFHVESAMFQIKTIGYVSMRFSLKVFT